LKREAKTSLSSANKWILTQAVLIAKMRTGSSKSALIFSKSNHFSNIIQFLESHCLMSKVFKKDSSKPSQTQERRDIMAMLRIAMLFQIMMY
jgi:hypothetical protein